MGNHKRETTKWFLAACTTVVLSALASTSATAQTYGKLGGGGGASYSAGTGIGISGGTISNTAPFGGHTIVQAPNAVGSLVNELDLNASLTTLTAGSEASQWVGTLLNGGTTATAFTAKPLSFQAPKGSTGAPGLSFMGATNYGLWADTSNFRLDFDVLGTDRGYIDANGQLWVNGGLGGLIIGTGFDTSFLRNSSADAQIKSGHDIVIGGDAALTTTATAGFLELPTSAGTPTGTVTVRTGKAAVEVDSTNNKLCWTTGGGTWKCVAGS